MADLDVDQPEVVLLEIGGHRRPTIGGRNWIRDMFAHAADAQDGHGSGNRFHKNSPSVRHCNDVPTGLQLGASLGANDAGRVTQ